MHITMGQAGRWSGSSWAGRQGVRPSHIQQGEEWGGSDTFSVGFFNTASDFGRYGLLS